MIVHAKTLREGDRVRPAGCLEDVLATVRSVDPPAKTFVIRYDDEDADRAVRWGRRLPLDARRGGKVNESPPVGHADLEALEDALRAQHGRRAAATTDLLGSLYRRHLIEAHGDALTPGGPGAPSRLRIYGPLAPALTEEPLRHLRSAHAVRHEACDCTEEV